MNKSGMLILAALLLAGCGKEEKAAAPKAPPPVLITVATAETRDLEVRETTVGTLEGLIDPVVAAEVPGRVLQVLVHAGQEVRKGQLIAVLDAQDYVLQRREAQAEIQRIEVLLANQARVVERNRRLVERNFIAQQVLDGAEAERDAFAGELEAARARLAGIERNHARARVHAPLDGRVEKQIVSAGDYAKVGDPLFQIVGPHRLRAHLPFPETAAARLASGQTVRLTTPTAPGEVVTTTVREIKPLIDSGNRAVNVIADVAGQPGWRPGASVNGVVVVGMRSGTVVVPEQSLVLRPAGEVVYVLRGEVVGQRVVRSGLREGGRVEIVDGLMAGETVAVDGAGYLTDQAAVKVQAP